jgi:hypothetical protein
MYHASGKGVDVYLVCHAYFCFSFGLLQNMHFSGSLSGNKGLCGVPTFPDCAVFWEKGGLNKIGKIALGVSLGFVLLVILIVVYILCIRRGPYDYDFEFPQDLTCKYISINPPLLSTSNKKLHDFCLLA